MNKLLLIAGLFSATVSAESFTVVFDANGNVLSDTRVPMDIPCEQRWSALTCKSIGVMEHLTRTTPHYQDGHYARVELLKQRREADRVAAEAARQAWQDDLHERSVLAAEANARANWANARKPPVRVTTIVNP